MILVVLLLVGLVILGVYCYVQFQKNKKNEVVFESKAEKSASLNETLDDDQAAEPLDKD